MPSTLPYKVKNKLNFIFLPKLELNEGWDLKLLTTTEIRQRSAYSPKANAHKAIGDIHRQIMLDFIASTTQY